MKRIIKKCIIATLLITFSCIVLSSCGKEESRPVSDDASFYMKKYIEKSISKTKEDDAGAEEEEDDDTGYKTKLPRSNLNTEEVWFSIEDTVKLKPESENDFVSAACYNMTRNEAIYENNVFEKVYPASITKIATALTVLKYCDLNDTIVISEDNGGINTKGAALCGFKKGDRITVENLLISMLIMSGNDAANELAVYTAGSVEAFCTLMNSYMKEILATDTNFVNPHGLHNDKHYTTAYDMYLIFNECLKSDKFIEIVSLRDYSVEYTTADGERASLEAKPTNLFANNVFDPPEGITVIGGKTGSTLKAGDCLILLSKNSRGEYIITEVYKSSKKETVYKETIELMKLGEKW